MPKKSEYLRELSEEEELKYLPVDFFGQVLEIGDYISYPVYRKGDSLQAVAKIREIHKGINIEGEIVYRIWIFVSTFDKEKQTWEARKTAMNVVHKSIKLPVTLIKTCYYRPDIKCIVDAKIEGK